MEILDFLHYVLFLIGKYALEISTFAGFSLFFVVFVTLLNHYKDEEREKVVIDGTFYTFFRKNPVLTSSLVGVIAGVLQTFVALFVIKHILFLLGVILFILIVSWATEQKLENSGISL